jgi:iron complex transport system ATP-binding protein
VYRRLRKENIPFAAGILYQNDVDHQLARLLASEVIAEEPFEEIRPETLRQAMDCMERCEGVLDAGVKIGVINQRIQVLIDRAKELGIYRKL